MASVLQPFNEYVQADVLQKLSYLSPGSIYHQMDEFSRDLLLYFSDTLGWGMGLGIAAVSLGIKLLYMPIMVQMQMNAQKMKLLEPETKNMQATIQRLQKMGDFKGIREAQQQYSRLRQKHGIKGWMALASFTQIPVLITWFLSLRYVTSMPDKFPALRTDGMLWFKDLAEMDPYFILPLLNATFSYYNIALNPNMQTVGAGTVFGKYMRYMRFFPFLSLPIVVFFPAAINLYWALSASTHLLVAVLVRSQAVRNFFRIPQYLPGTILEKLNQKHTQKVVKAVIQDAPPHKMAQSIAQSLMPKQAAALNAAGVGAGAAAAAAAAANVAAGESSAKPKQQSN